uniref:Uncharacterized protein n=1 Tax=Arundo donax TaxID=35708 RepID=A0A0A9FYG2_ARUDO
MYIGFLLLLLFTNEIVLIFCCYQLVLIIPYISSVLTQLVSFNW